MKRKKWYVVVRMHEHPNDPPPHMHVYPFWSRREAEKFVREDEAESRIYHSMPSSCEKPRKMRSSGPVENRQLLVGIAVRDKVKILRIKWKIMEM